MTQLAILQIFSKLKFKISTIINIILEYKKRVLVNEMLNSY